MKLTLRTSLASYLALTALVLVLVGLAPNALEAAQKYHLLAEGGSGLIRGDLVVKEDLTIEGTTTYLLGATEKFLVDGATTPQTQTDGMVDFEFASVTANTKALNLDVTMNDGTASGDDVFGHVMTLTCNDANGDLFGLKIVAAATTNAGAGSYEALASIDCAENTSGACPDGLLITSSGIAAGMTTAVNASAANITNAISVGSNNILGDNTDSCTVGATDASFICSRNDAGEFVYQGADNAGAADTRYDTTGAGAVYVGSADVTSVTIVADGTTDADFVAPLTSIGAGEMVLDTVDGPQLADSIALDVALGVIGTAGEVVTFTRTLTDATSESGVRVHVTPSDTTAAVTNQYGLEVICEASTEGCDAVLFVEHDDADDLATNGLLVSSGAGGMTHGLNVSDPEIVNGVSVGSNLILGDNGESISVGATDDVFLLTRDDAGTVTLTSADDDATAALTLDPGGNATLTLGSASDTVTVAATSGVTLANSESVNAGTDATFDFTRNDAGTVTLTCSDDDATCAMIYDAGGAASIQVGSADVTSVTVVADGATDADFEIPLTSIAADEVVLDTLDFAQLADSLALDAATTVTGTAGETISWVAAATDGAAAWAHRVQFTALDTGAATTSQHALIVECSPSSESCDTGVVIENADADDTMTNAIRVAATGAITTGLNVSDSGIVNAIDVGANECIGSATIGANPAYAANTWGIGTTGIIFEGSVADEFETLWTVSNPTGDVTLTGPATTGTLVGSGDTATVTATMVADVVRAIPLPLAGWFECTGRTAVSLDDGADADPDFTVINSALTIAYDDTGGSPDTDEVCTSFQVPQDYVSGGTFVFRMTQDGATGVNVESVECRISVDGAAIGAADEDNLADQTAVQSVTSAPTGTWAAGAAIGIVCKQGNATPDDIVYWHAVEARYTATQ